ncbi:Lam6p NDAI_0C06560 [Naumovozyma dairenensis CBS 421]|uniref:VASt domain-containing protein n=1 Tax=Naumovozyma dairenensis (strain ATCC 10597 / BCRC 20456 / CBS 421 / NBRC 0211 / NRRL Y-12639) TaxID=1071378 RepID=G0W954_NAUDC|nr:hypothetical protein NDAI_0C06560 [Naumovozyma dairenensis CBS 421]CCD24315.1 hypothetical protein NDAI_0C06560 [Naumovozyma dairenensis CBS 421]
MPFRNDRRYMVADSKVCKSPVVDVLENQNTDQYYVRDNRYRTEHKCMNLSLSSCSSSPTSHNGNNNGIFITTDSPSNDMTLSLSLKSSPANPHTSDINSISNSYNISGFNNKNALESVNDLISLSIQTNTIVSTKGSGENENNIKSRNQSISESMTSSSSFLDNVFNAFQLKPKQQQQQRLSKINTSSDVSLSSPIHTISSKKHLTPMPNYYMASSGRNQKFHKLFNINHSKNDNLIDDFNCTLVDDSIPGKLYVSESYIRFYPTNMTSANNNTDKNNNNNVNIIIEYHFKDIKNIEKTEEEGIAIHITTEDGNDKELLFCNFVSLYPILVLLLNLWSQINKLNDDIQKIASNKLIRMNELDHIIPSPDYMMMIRPLSRNGIMKNKQYMTNEPISFIEEAINSIDGDEQRLDGNLVDDNEEGSNSSQSIGSFDSSIRTNSEIISTKKPIFKFKEQTMKSCNFKYNGPYYHHETEFPYHPEDHNEYILTELILNGSPGLIFEILFSEHNPEFLLEFLESQDSHNISDINEFHNSNTTNYPFRNYSYIKNLKFSVGPKSTNCNVEETLIYYDLYDYINIVNTTKTPNVPSGGSFSTKTRYMLRWNDETHCFLKISYWVEWSGSSWIKSLVESSCKTGLISSTKDLVNQLQRYLDKYVEESNDESSMVNNNELLNKMITEEHTIVNENIIIENNNTRPKEIKADNVVREEKIGNMPEMVSIKMSKKLLILVMILVIFLICLNIYYIFSLKRSMNRIEALLSRTPTTTNRLSDFPAKFFHN